MYERFRVHEKAKAVVQMTLTIADEELSKKLESGVCNTKRRYEVLKEFQKNGIPTVVWMSPFYLIFRIQEKMWKRLWSIALMPA